MLKDLQNEIRMMQKVDHPNIARLYEIYDEAAYIYLIMELCPNGDLWDKMLTLGEIEEKEASAIMFKISKALLHCHTLNIMHRDIKPENIVFGLDNEPKLVDFGFATE